MTRKMMTKIVALMMCLVLSFALCACTQTPQSEPIEVVETQVETTATDALWVSAVYTEDVTLGEGKTSIEVVVTAGEKSITFTINTDKRTLRGALLDSGLVQGEDSEYGLFILTVNGILADYDVDKSYWALYHDGEYATTGADSIKITDGEIYELRYSK